MAKKRDTSDGVAEASAPGADAPLVGHKVLRPREQVETALRQAILSGQVATGQRLPAESELARQFSVSRPTIRAALSALETQRLIRKVPGTGGGSFVNAADHNALGQVVQESMHGLLKLGSVTFDEVAIARQCLEVPSAILAARHHSDEDIKELREIAAKQKKRSVDDPLVGQLDANFHVAIARVSDNRVLAALVYALHRESEPLNYLELSPEMGRTTVAQHKQIVDAIASGDEDLAAEAITTHLTYLRDHINATVAESDAA